MFPPLPSPANPYVGAAAEAGSLAARLASGWRSAQAGIEVEKQRQAAAKVVHEDARLHQSFEDARQLSKDGFVPSEVYPNGDPLPGRPTLMTPEANPAAAGGGETITDTTGRKYTKKPELDDNNSFIPSGQLADMLEAAGHKRGTRLKPSDSHAIMQALNEAQPENQMPENTLATVDANGNRVLLQRGTKTGKLTTAQLPDGVTLAEKPEKPDAQSILPGQVGPKGGVLVFNKSTQTVEEVPLPKGSRQEMTAGQKAADADRDAARADREEGRSNRRNDAQQKVVDTFTAKHDKLQELEQKAWTKKQMYADAMEVKDGEMAVDPRSNQQVVMNAARRKVYENQKRQAETEAMGHQEEAKKIRKRIGGGEFEQKQAAPAAAEKPAAPAKSATMQHVRDYAKQKGIPEAQAIRDFKASGYSIGQ